MSNYLEQFISIIFLELCYGQYKTLLDQYFPGVNQLPVCTYVYVIMKVSETFHLVGTQYTRSKHTLIVSKITLIWLHELIYLCNFIPQTAAWKTRMLCKPKISTTCIFPTDIFIADILHCSCSHLHFIAINTNWLLHCIYWFAMLLFCLPILRGKWQVFRSSSRWNDILSPQ